MIRTSEKYHKYGFIELLSGQPTGSGFGEVRPIKSIDDLRMRFHYAILSAHASPLADKWRNDCQISVMGEQWIHFPYRDMGGWTDSEAEIKEKLTAFLETKGTLAVQLNPSHPRAKEIKQAVDILDLGFWLTNGNYTPAEEDFRDSAINNCS
jgi:hypothetical protein